MELDSTTKSFGGVQVVVVETRLFGNTINTFVFWPAAPAPGMGAVNGSDSYTGVAGREYKITITMQFKNAANVDTYTTATKTFTP